MEKMYNHQLSFWGMKLVAALSMALPIALLIACDSTQNEPTIPTVVEQGFVQTKDYYYPIDKLTVPKVYEYSMVYEGEYYIDQYWRVQRSERDGATYLQMQGYNPLFQQNMYTEELILEDGVLTQKYDMLQLDSATQELKRYPNTLTQSIIFPFRTATDSQMVYRYETTSKTPPQFVTTKLVRDRKFKEFSTFDYQEKTYEAAIFSIKNLYDIEDKENGGFWNMTAEGEEVYAKGLGLVQKRTVNDQGEVSLEQLTNVYSLAEFEEKMKNAEMKNDVLPQVH